MQNLRRPHLQEVPSPVTRTQRRNPHLLLREVRPTVPAGHVRHRLLQPSRTTPTRFHQIGQGTGGHRRPRCRRKTEIIVEWQRDCCIGPGFARRQGLPVVVVEPNNEDPVRLAAEEAVVRPQHKQRPEEEAARAEEEAEGELRHGRLQRRLVQRRNRPSKAVARHDPLKPAGLSDNHGVAAAGGALLYGEVQMRYLLILLCLPHSLTH